MKVEIKGYIVQYQPDPGHAPLYMFFSSDKMSDPDYVVVKAHTIREDVPADKDMLIAKRVEALKAARNKVYTDAEFIASSYKDKIQNWLALGNEVVDV